MGRGGGQVVSEFAFLSDNPSSNPAAAYSFYVKFVFEKNKNKQEEAGLAHFFKKVGTNNLYLHYLHLLASTMV